MQRFLSLPGAAVLLVVLAGAVDACGSDRALTSKLKRYGFEVDAATLTRTQRAQVCRALSSPEIGLNKRNEIHAALKSN